jgi:hypothetical protein
MFIEIKKGTPLKKIKSLLKKRTGSYTRKNIDSFFGKLPMIEDGLIFQKKVRSERNNQFNK